LKEENFLSGEESRRKDLEVSQLRYEEESWRRRGEENEASVEGLHREIDLLKGERRADWHKIDGREKECDDLKNEIFMLKKFVVDIERRDMEIDGLKARQYERAPRGAQGHRGGDRPRREFPEAGGYDRDANNRDFSSSEQDLEFTPQNDRKKASRDGYYDSANGEGYSSSGQGAKGNFCREHQPSGFNSNPKEAQPDTVTWKRGDVNIITWKNPASPQREGNFWFFHFQNIF
jgi:hypothetical protein